MPEQQISVVVVNNSGWWSIASQELGIGGSGCTEAEARLAFLRSMFSLLTTIESEIPPQEVEKPRITGQKNIRTAPLHRYLFESLPAATHGYQVAR